MKKNVGILILFVLWIAAGSFIESHGLIIEPVYWGFYGFVWGIVVACCIFGYHMHRSNPDRKVVIYHGDIVMEVSEENFNRHYRQEDAVEPEPVSYPLTE